MICSSIFPKAIILGVCGGLKFAVNDGTIVLFSSRYNLGRLEKVIDLYYNDDEDVYTTIEEDVPSPTFAPIAAPTTSPPTRDPANVISVGKNVSIIFLSPEEAIAMGLPGAVDPSTGPPNTAGSSNSNGFGGGGGSGGGGSSSGSTGSSTQSSENKHDYTITIGSIPHPTAGKDMKRRETIHVKLIWGVESIGKEQSLWVTNSGIEPLDSILSSASALDLAEPRTQEWLLEVVQMAKNNTKLFVRQDKLTWIERLRDFASYAGVEFPIPKHLFVTYLQLLKLKDRTFDETISTEIGTTAAGLAGDFTFASITVMVDAVEAGNAAKASGNSTSENIYKEWTEFAAEANELSPPDIPSVTAQSSIFLDAYRIEATVDSTLVTWFVANGLCLLVILVFLQNIALSLMVMVTIILILFCLGGLLFAVFRVPFGPVEALGVSIFIGLSANYS